MKKIKMKNLELQKQRLEETLEGLRDRDQDQDQDQYRVQEAPREEPPEIQMLRAKDLELKNKEQALRDADS